PDVDEYAENVTFRTFNEALLRGENSVDSRTEFLESLPEPWVLKDPRFALTDGNWEFPAGTSLVWMTRGLKDVEHSIRRQNWGKESPRGLLVRGKTLPETQELCRKIFERWEGPKMHLQYEQLQEAVGLFTGPHRSQPSHRRQRFQ